MKITVISVLVVANLAVLAMVWALQKADRILATANTDPDVQEVLDRPSGDSLTFLIVGSDSREGLDDLTNFGAVGGARGDVIMLGRVDGESSSLQLLSIPRDLWVDIPGHGQDRINATYAFGGPRLLVETIRANLGVEINHYVEIDFVGFIAVVDQLGGVEIAFPFAARDLQSGLDVEAGPQVLDGDMALAYARSRKYQEFRNGSWVSVKANDIGRTERQQEVVAAILRKLVQPSSIAEAGQMVETFGRNLTIDSGLATANAASLAWDFRGVLTGQLDGATLPVVDRSIDGKSVVVAVEPDASEMIANFKRGVTLSDRPPRLQVLNGNGLAGAAGAVSRELEVLGFQVISIGDADDQSYPQTLVLVRQGSPVGTEVVEALGYGVVQFGDVGNEYDAVVIVGLDAS
ncbi:MAG: LCP family protein [Acidimicrobiia bacterium]|nr:LCP family protein [Acidimicrobiia bacterium]